MKGVSGRKVAKALGISEGAIRKLKGPGKPLAGAMHAGGSFDLARAKALYGSNVDTAMQRDRPAARPAPSQNSDGGLSDAGPAPSDVRGWARQQQPDDFELPAISILKARRPLPMEEASRSGINVPRGLSSNLVPDGAVERPDEIGVTGKASAKVDMQAFCVAPGWDVREPVTTTDGSGPHTSTMSPESTHLVTSTP